MQRILNTSGELIYKNVEVVNTIELLKATIKAKVDLTDADLYGFKQ